MDNNAISQMRIAWMHPREKEKMEIPDLSTYSRAIWHEAGEHIHVPNFRDYLLES
jgi:hypothetical protein|tara:strand:- start:554 stop:718 length:165 start_codon:yes stop_codon:yes gene_type:complete